MTTDITFSDAEFAFTHDGVHYHVSTEVGDGPARVVVQETVLAEDDNSMEHCDEQRA